MEAHISLPPDPTDEAMASANYGAVHAELKKLNNPERKWGKSLMVFAITLALFAMTGWVRYNDPIFLGMLVGILFFHELGHFVAMRLFGYRNVRMFFIPLFGAAVSGRSFQPSGWKKAVVSLMGPLPGVIVGTALLGTFLWGHQPPWVLRLGLMLIFLNLFNLLPLQPLDGGRYINTVLFCRNRWLEAAFRVITSLLMGLLAWKLSSIILGVVAYVMLASTPISYRCAAIANRLRGHLPKPAPDSDELPPQAVMMIVDEIRTVLPQLKTDAKIAATALNIYEEATTRPPSWLVSVGLLVLYPVVFLCPLTPWVVAAWHRPVLIQEWRGNLIRSHAARHAQSKAKSETAISTDPADPR